MIVTFHTKVDQLVTNEDLNEFEQLIGRFLPIDYRQHMLQYNGGGANQYNLENINYIGDGDIGLSYFLPIKYGSGTIEHYFPYVEDYMPEGYILIGASTGGGDIIMSLNDDSTYGYIDVLFSDGTRVNLAPSFTQFLEDQVEGED